MLYLTVYRLNEKIGQVELNKEFEIHRQSKHISFDIIVEGNKILLPYFDSVISRYIGSPHGKISPISEYSGLYTQIFKSNETVGMIEETKKSWLFIKETITREIPIKNGQTLELCCNKKGVTRYLTICKAVSLWVSNEPF